MHPTVEEIQIKSRKIVSGIANVYFVIFSFILVYLFNSIPVFAVSLAIFITISLYSAGLDYLKFMKIPSLFLLPALFVITLITPGDKLFWIFSKDGLYLAFKTFLRTYTSLSMMVYLISTTTIPELLYALQKLKLPEFVAEMMTLIYRTIQIFVDELMRLERSAESRLGFFGRKNMLKTSALLGYSMFIKSMDRAEKLNMAMESRCYNGKIPNPSNSSSGIFYALTIIAIIATAGVIF